ncbi:MAG: winged helix-turn-helix domain-containing protein [Devosia sp.]
MIPTVSEDAVFQFGAFTLDVRRGTVVRERAEIFLRPKAYSLLLCLARNMGRVVPKAELMDAVWPDVYVTEDSLTQSIREIRKALGDDEQHIVRTVSRRGYVLSGAEATPIVAKTQPIVAVLRFQNEGNDPANEGLVDGFAEDIINGLARFGSMAVLARTSSFEFSSFAADAWSDAASRIGADYLVEGSVRRRGNRFVVAVNLIAAAKQKQLWGEKYEADDVELFAIQREIGEQIVSRLVSRLDDDRAHRAEIEPAASLAVYELVIRGAKYLRPVMDKPIPEARALFNEAIARDPSYGLAYAYLALEMVVAAGLGKASREVLAEATRLVGKCISLSPNQSFGYRVLSIIRLYAREHAGAVHDLQRSLELNPCDAEAIEQMGYILVLRGRPLEAIEWIDKAVKLNPLYPWWYDFDRALSHYLLGEYRAATDILDRARRLTAWMPTLQAAAYAQLGEIDIAARHARAITQTDPDFSALDEARGTLAFENASDNEHLVEGVALALGGLARIR